MLACCFPRLLLVIQYTKVIFLRSLACNQQRALLEDDVS